MHRTKTILECTVLLFPGQALYLQRLGGISSVAPWFKKHDLNNKVSCSKCSHSSICTTWEYRAQLHHVPPESKAAFSPDPQVILKGGI